MQTKIGLDKFPVPSIESEVPLYDIVTGERLIDQSGLPLVTDAELAISQIANSSRATSVVIGKDIAGVPVIEQFPETSETATTLLGITRSETQLSLFSDVSVLGLDTDVWETYSYGTGTSYGPWETRASRDFGNHYTATLIEETGEQAIRLGAFPVPYSYPFGPKFADVGYYNQTQYAQYKNFITLGNFLYEYYSQFEYLDSRGRPFEDNFLDYSKVKVTGDEIEFIGITEAQGFALIDTWTRAWVDIQNSYFENPAAPGQLIDVKFINAMSLEISGISRPQFDTTRPGYSTSARRFVYLQSKKAYRYQPGRISGFTFGAKASTDAGSNQNIIEWGIANPTDQYVFQIQGASFSIVRRSTVELDQDVILAQGLDPSSQTFQPSGNPYDSTNYHTLKIPREYFNGDTLDGNGRSNYLLNANNVTMYKIEFGWYGAIGAKFYAYVPVDSGECRWVLVHTLVIENKLGQPCLEDPYFRFKYSVDILNNASLREPQFIYKYGASCYIDGGDTGTVTQKSYSSGERLLSSDPRPILGIWPKLNIVNKDGVAKANKKIIYPKSLSVSSSNLTRLDIVKCKACPGFGFGYNHGLQGAESGRVINIKFINLNTIAPTEGEYFTNADIGSKIIADGLWSGYIKDLNAQDTINPDRFYEAIIERIINIAFDKETRPFPDQVIPRATGELLTIPIGSDYPYAVRLSQYNGVAASAIPLTGSKIEINFMNPRAKESLGHWAEFLIGVTDIRPFYDLDTLKWEYSISDIRDTLPLDDMIYGEYVPATTSRDREGYEVGESNPNIREIFDIDNRIPPVPGITGGLCSKLTIEVLEKERKSAQMVEGNPNPNPDLNIETIDGYYIKLAPNIQFGIETILGGEVGLFDGVNYIETGVTFISVAATYQDGFDEIYYAKISEPISGVTVGANITIAFTPLRAYGQYINKVKVVKFNPYPLYLVCMLRDNAIVNSISVTETIGDTTITSTPKWLTNSNSSKYPAISPAEDDLPPVNFLSQDRLDAAAIDIQLEQTLRQLVPGPSDPPNQLYDIIDSFYVAANETLDIDLTSIFGADRSNITPDALNLEATFIIGKTVDSSNGTIQLSLNTAEQ